MCRIKAEQIYFELPTGLPKEEKNAAAAYKIFIEESRAAVKNHKISPAERQQKLETLSKTGIKEIFLKENLSLSLIEDRLKALKKETEIKSFDVWAEFLEHSRRKASGTGRLIVALGNESPSAILPAENLYVVRQILDEVAHLKSNMSLFGKCLIPQDLLEAYGARTTDVGLSLTTPQTAALIREILNRLEGIMKDVEVLPALIQNRRLRFGVSVILSLTNSMIKKYKKADVLQKKVDISAADKIKARLFAFGKWCYAGLPRKGTVL